MHVFETQNAVWLKSKTSVRPHEKLVTSSELKTGRPQLTFSQKSNRSKRRHIMELSKKQNNEAEPLVLAAAMAARKSDQLNLAVVLKETVSSPTRASKLRKLVSTAAPVKLSADEALAFLLENNFSKEQYCNIRHESKIRNYDIYPLYKDLTHSKYNCRPNGVLVTEKIAKVPLEMLLKHTAERIIKLQSEVLSSIMERKQTDILYAELIVSYGFDSSSGYTNYKQQFQKAGSSQMSDSSLLATTIIPLRLLESSGNILRNNCTPQSTRFFRPLKLEYTKENRENILKEKQNIEEEINALNTLVVNIGDKRMLHVKFRLYLTLIDGKVLNILTGTKSSQACSICGATPKDFIAITDFQNEKFKPKKENLKYGISPLHCWIRFFEFVLNAGYKNNIKKWQIRNEADKKLVANRKCDIQQYFWDELGLNVDKPKTGGFGSTNDGNTARRAFNEHVKFAKITGVDEELIFNLKIILICLSCQLPLNLSKFEAFCFQTAKICIEKYPWLPMTATVHKVLLHSRQIIESTVLPVGCFGEDAAESRHKLYKADRLFHARKSSRINNLADIFNRALDTSDPFISSLSLGKRIRHQKKLKLPLEVIDLLRSEETDFAENYQQEEEQNSESEDEETRNDVVLNSGFLDLIDNLELQNEIL